MGWAAGQRQKKSGEKASQGDNEGKKKRAGSRTEMEKEAIGTKGQRDRKAE